MKKLFLSITVASLLLASCSSESDDSGSVRTTDGIEFTGSIDKLKVLGSAWEAGDDIAVIMKKKDQILMASTVLVPNGKPVAEYETKAGDGLFVSDDFLTKLFYPLDGSAVDFIAFYPDGDYDSNDHEAIRLVVQVGKDQTTYDVEPNLGTYILKVDALEQDDQDDLDLLYANNLTNRSSANPGSKLEFTRKMSKVEINITAGTGLTDANLNDLESYFYGPSNFGIFNLTSGKFDKIFHDVSAMQGKARPFMISMEDANHGRFAEATLFPEVILGQTMNGAVSEPTRIEFRLRNGEVYKWLLPTGLTLQGGKKYVYNIAISKTATGENKAVEINQSTISNWDTAPAQNGTAQ